MKNKLYIFSILSLLIVTGFYSCEEFLDREPLSNYSNESLGVTEKDTSDTKTFSADEMESLLKGAYADFKNEYFMLDYFIIGDAQSDNAYAGADNPNMFEVDEFRIIATNQLVNRDWGYLYGMVAKCNTVIENVANTTGLSQERKDQILGEASFIRAWAYFDIVRLWGTVPVILKDVSGINSENLPEVYPILYPEPKTSAEVYQQIISDLEVALPKVRESAPDKGYATKGAVNALMAKVYAALHDYEKVKTFCDAVIAGGYSLLPEYDKLWDNSVENSSESIFEINCYDWGTGGNWGVFMFAGTDWKKFCVPSNDLVKAFDEEGDLIRKNSSITFADVTGKWTDKYWTTDNYPFVNKYRDFSGAQNFILIRLADILLLKAEAMIETGDISGSMALVNQVRARAGLPSKSAASANDARLIVEKERRLELAFEGHRWFDLVRTGRAITVMNNQRDGKNRSLGYQVSEYKLLWPIPQSELDKNPKLIQNPGY